MAEATGAPIDLLRGFGGGGGEPASAAEDDAGEVELSLGLSLGGRYGTERRGGLVRASSIASLAPAGEGERGRPLMRTCSLPAEGEEEVRRRREAQMLRRMEAKRKRMERRGARVGGRERAEEAETAGGCAGADAVAQCRRLAAGPAAKGAPGGAASQGSCSGSTGGGDSNCGFMQALDISGNTNTTETKNPSNIQSSRSCGFNLTRSPVASAAAMLDISSSSVSEEVVGHAPRETFSVTDGSRSVARTVIEQMPCVYTMPKGPNGKRVEGFLYKYGNGEEVRIVCVCHGSFLTPAEFVKHAGGGDVDNPLRHIVVNPSPPTFQ